MAIGIIPEPVDVPRQLDYLDIYYYVLRMGTYDANCGDKKLSLRR